MKRPAKTSRLLASSTKIDRRKGRQNPVSIQLQRNQARASRSPRWRVPREGKLEQASSPSGLEIHQQAHAQQLQHENLETDNSAATNECQRTTATTVTTTTTIVHNKQNEPSTPRSPHHEIQELIEQDRELELERLHSLHETMHQKKAELHEQQQFVDAAVEDMQAELELINDPVVAQLDPERCARSREAIAHQVYNNTLAVERSSLDKDIRAIDEAKLDLEHEIERVTGTESAETDADEHGHTADGNSDGDDSPNSYHADSECDDAQPSHVEEGDYSSYADDEDHDDEEHEDLDEAEDYDAEY